MVDQEMIASFFYRSFFLIVPCALLFSSLAIAKQVQPEESEIVTVCYNYGCNSTTEITILSPELEAIFLTMQTASSAQEEREILAEVIGQLYRIAGHQSPIFRDRGGNFDDDKEAYGAMDCIDHSTTANEFLHLLERRGWLTFHRVASLVSRGAMLSIHWAAQIQDKTTGDYFVVDRWFFDHGYPAAVMPLSDWENKKDPIMPRGKQE